MESSNQFLGTERISKLMQKYAIPCIISLLVGALYNIVDQIFIANASYLGSYGNAANTVVFPLTVVALAIAVMIGDGCCAFVSISLGQSEVSKARRSVGNAVVMCLVSSIVLAALYLVFADNILAMFGGTVNAETYHHSQEYFFYITLGVPFYMFGQAMNPIIRADGNPRFAMISTLAGAVLNIILDPVFIFGLRWGMMGAAVATVIGQLVTAALAVWYLLHMKIIRPEKGDYRLKGSICGRTLTLGMTSFLSQISLVAAMAAINNMIRKYGALDTVFGQEQYAQIPIKQFLTKGYGMQFTTDPLLPGSPGCIALSQPVRCGKGTLHRGSTYLALDTAIITDPAAGYSLTDGSALYWEMGSRLWQIENGSLTETENRLREVDYTLRTGSNNGVTEQTAWQGKVQLDDQKYYVVKVTLNGRSAALVQLLPANTFLLHYGVYLWLVALGTAIIWGLSFLMQHWLERVITRPVEALQKRIETVGSGNFAPDRTVEWNNELGDIGRGINQLAENVDSLMTRRVEDERRKQELEYRMLQNEVNPHFIYNTLNSIRWMATIQHAPGIAEMVTAFARLTKSISKGTQKLVPLQEELALLNDYFTIQQYRYGGDLEIEVSRIESETLCRDCMIPRFTLQPLVENAIFHGLEPKGGHGSVLLDISTDSDTGDVLLRITDDGVGMPPELVAHLLDEPAEGAEKAEKFRHVGLWNVNRRIRYSFGEGYGLTIESEEDVGTEVTIRLPYQQKGDTHAADITGG